MVLGFELLNYDQAINEDHTTRGKKIFNAFFKNRKVRMDKKTTLKTLEQLIQLETKAILTYDQALETVTDSVIRAQLESLKARHADHAELLSSQILKMANEMIAEHWDAITSAALRGQIPEAGPKMRFAANS